MDSTQMGALIALVVTGFLIGLCVGWECWGRAEALEHAYRRGFIDGQMDMREREAP